MLSGVIQNILNNPYALQEIEKATHITGIPFEGKSVVLKEQAAAFFEVSLRTVENYLSQYEEELGRNGYEVIKGKRLKSFKPVLQEMNVSEINFGNIAKNPQLGILDFRFQHRKLIASFKKKSPSHLARVWGEEEEKE